MRANNTDVSIATRLLSYYIQIYLFNEREGYEVLSTEYEIGNVHNTIIKVIWDYNEQ